MREGGQGRRVGEGVGGRAGHQIRTTLKIIIQGSFPRIERHLDLCLEGLTTPLRKFSHTTHPRTQAGRPHRAGTSLQASRGKDPRGKPRGSDVHWSEPTHEPGDNGTTSPKTSVRSSVSQ